MKEMTYKSQYSNHHMKHLEEKIILSIFAINSKWNSSVITDTCISIYVSHIFIYQTGWSSQSWNEWQAADFSPQGNVSKSSNSLFIQGKDIVGTKRKLIFKLHWGKLIFGNKLVWSWFMSCSAETDNQQITHI